MSPAGSSKPKQKSPSAPAGLLSIFLALAPVTIPGLVCGWIICILSVKRIGIPMALAPLIGLSYVEMMWIALPYTIALSIVGMIAISTAS